MLKIACMLIEQHCRSNNQEIIGLYHASAQASGLGDITPVKPIVDKIASNFSSASVWSFDGSKLADSQFAFKGQYHAKDEWKSIINENVSLSDEALKHASRVISEMKYLEIVDFDDHLTDASLSWLNQDLFKKDPLEDVAAVSAVDMQP